MAVGVMILIAAGALVVAAEFLVDRGPWRTAAWIGVIGLLAVASRFLV